MMTVREAYWDWLVKKTGQPGYGREKQLEVLHAVAFVPHVQGDENREWYGKHLRDIWYDEYRWLDYIDPDKKELEAFMDESCSVLEMLLALAESMYEQADGTAPYSPIGWFWVMVDNLGIRRGSSLKTVRARARNFVDREYTPEGVGSIFPLQDTVEDQRNVEIWYQMMTYLSQNGY